MLVGEHNSEMVGSTCIRWGFFDYYFVFDYYYFVFDYHDFDNGCDAVGDDNGCTEQQLWQHRHDNDYNTNIANTNRDMVTNHCAHHHTVTKHPAGCVIFW